MSIENHVVSREIAERLKAAGFPQNTVFSWALLRGKWYIIKSPCLSGADDCPAPLLSEVLEQLPEEIEQDDLIYDLVIQKGLGFFACFACYSNENHLDRSALICERDDNPANAAALLYLWWKEIALDTH